jgi:hypothetical protein
VGKTVADIYKLPVYVPGLNSGLYAAKLTDLAAFAPQREEAIGKYCEEAKALHRGYFVFGDGRYEVFLPNSDAD